jgi:tetratricopeptide (TPR) repeat protein
LYDGDVPLGRSFPLSALNCLFFLGLAFPARAATVLVLQFHNASQYRDLSWVGESISDTLQDQFNAQNQIVFGRHARLEALRRMGLRSDGDFTKATLIRLGQSLDADYVSYGSYDVKLPAGTSELKNSSIQISAHMLDLRKLHEGPDLSEAGQLSDLSRLEEHLAWQSLRYFAPSLNLPLNAFLSPEKLIRSDAEESYIRGLISTNQDQQVKWFTQAAALDPHFVNPIYELGRVYGERKEYRQALAWLLRVPATDSHYPEARFRMGLAAYSSGDYISAVSYFRELAKAYPLNEVFNNLGAAESQLKDPAAPGDFRRALEGDPNDAVYLFNLGSILLEANNFDEAAKYLASALSHEPDNDELHALLDRAQRREAFPSGDKTMTAKRLKSNFDITAYRQLKAVMRPGGSE